MHENDGQTAALNMQHRQIVKVAVGERIMSLRGKESRASFSKRFGVAINTVNRYENGVTIPDAGFLATLCSAYSVTADWILFGEKQCLCNDGEANPTVGTTAGHYAPETKGNQNKPQPQSASTANININNSIEHSRVYGGRKVEDLPFDEFEAFWDRYRSEKASRRGWLQIEIIKHFPDFAEWVQSQLNLKQPVSSTSKY